MHRQGQGVARTRQVLSQSRRAAASAEIPRPRMPARNSASRRGRAGRDRKARRLFWICANRRASRLVLAISCRAVLRICLTGHCAPIRAFLEHFLIRLLRAARRGQPRRQRPRPWRLAACAGRTCGARTARRGPRRPPGGAPRGPRRRTCAAAAPIVYWSSMAAPDQSARSTRTAARKKTPRRSRPCWAGTGVAARVRRARRGRADQQLSREGPPLHRPAAQYIRPDQGRAPRHGGADRPGVVLANLSGAGQADNRASRPDHSAPWPRRAVGGG